MGGRAAADGAAGRGGVPGGGCAGGGARFGSSLGCIVLVPVGPLNDTSRGVMLSIRQPLTASPSATLNGLSPLTAKIAMRRPGSVTIPVSLVSARSESFAPGEAVWAGRRVLLNSGRASI